MTAPLISCIVPVFNGEPYLAEALDSVLAQTYRPLELIVSDDGSTDGTPGIAAAYGERIVYLREPNAGPAAARNRGLRVARGPFVAFLDADDLWAREKLEMQMARFEAHRTLALCCAYVQNCADPSAARAGSADDRVSQIIRSCTIISLLARRRVFDTVGVFDPGLAVGEDTEWFLRAAQSGAVREVVPRILAYHRWHPGSLSARRALACRDALLHNVRGVLERRRQQARARAGVVGEAEASPAEDTQA